MMGNALRQSAYKRLRGIVIFDLRTPCTDCLNDKVLVPYELLPAVNVLDSTYGVEEKENIS